jgi:thiamine-monophosphate kinase
VPREFEIIARHFAPLAGPEGLGLVDDAAKLVPAPGHDLILTTDAIVSGVHFFNDDPPDTIGRKALGVNLSDLAAKGAAPRAFLLTLALPSIIDDVWLADFAEGLGALAEASGCALVGGDTVATSGPLVISITAIGEVPTGRMVKRGGAMPGDFIYVSGTIGDAAIGLQVLLADKSVVPLALADDLRTHLIARYHVPAPRIFLGPVLRQHARAAMDISDGFVGDLRKMLALPGVGATINLGDVPLSVAARAAIKLRPDFFRTALTGGDDYEVLAAVAPAHSAAFERDCLGAGMRVTLVGQVTQQGAPVLFVDSQGHVQEFKKGSYEH